MSTGLVFSLDEMIDNISKHVKFGYYYKYIETKLSDNDDPTNMHEIYNFDSKEEALESILSKIDEYVFNDSVFFKYISKNNYSIEISFKDFYIRIEPIGFKITSNDFWRYNIFESVVDGDINGIKRWIDKYENFLNVKNENGQTLLHVAIENMQIEVIKLLFSTLSDIEIKEYMKPIRVSSINDDIAQLLLSKGIDVYKDNVVCCCSISNKHT